MIRPREHWKVVFNFLEYIGVLTQLHLVTLVCHAHHVPIMLCERILGEEIIGHSLPNIEGGEVAVVNPLSAPRSS